MLSRWKGERACRMPSRELFSQPSPTNSTKEALGFRAMEHSSFWMFSPSSPSWEQPNWWGRAKMPSKEPPTKDWASWASRWADGVHTPHCGQNVNLVADAHVPPGPRVAPKAPLPGRQGDRLELVVILGALVQVGAEVVGVHPFPRGDVLGGPADDFPVFDDKLPLGDGPPGHLGGQRAPRRPRQSGRLHCPAGR